MDPDATVGGGPGDVFIQSAGYKQIQRPDQRPQQWSSGPVEVPLQMKGTLLESGAGGPGGGLTPPYYQPGAVSKLLEPLGVADLFGVSQTTASQVRYVNEGTATNAAAGVAEGALKPESTLAYSEVVEPVKKIATLLPVSDEMLEDAPSIQAYLNGRLSLFVSVEEEEQLLRGAGGNDLVGLIGRAGVNTYTRLAADNNAESLAKVIANTAGSAFVQPDAIIMHPSNWLATRLLRAARRASSSEAGRSAPHTEATARACSARRCGICRWCCPTRWVPAPRWSGRSARAAMIWRRGGVSVEASSSHSDYFARNLTALRAEERLALGVYRPVAFTVISGLT